MPAYGSRLRVWLYAENRTAYGGLKAPDPGKGARVICDCISKGPVFFFSDADPCQRYATGRTGDLVSWRVLISVTDYRVALPD